MDKSVSKAMVPRRMPRTGFTLKPELKNIDKEVLKKKMTTRPRTGCPSIHLLI